MMVNLLARAVGVVDTVRVVCPPRIPLAGRVVPLAPRDLPLHGALVHGGQAIAAAPVRAATAPAGTDAVLVVGADPDHRDDERAYLRFVSGQGWWGGVSDHPMPYPGEDSDLPYGPYVAAALAVGEIYLHARLPLHVARPTGGYGWDCWAQTLAAQPVPGAPTDLAGLDLSGTALAGVGAVGSTWVHTLWATPGLVGEATLADADLKGVTTTNFNRCTIFGRASLHEPKASEAARIASDAAIIWQPHDGKLEDLGVTPTLLVSAVDTNRARQALQHRYPPLILSGSTLDLRSEALRTDRPGADACLRCYNPPETFTGDDELRVRAREGGSEVIRELAAEAQVSESDVQRWIERGGCDEVGKRVLDTLRRQTPEPPARFAVGFTSVMAGVMLAAETVKVLLSHPMTPMAPESNNATFQFLHPAAPVNAARRLAPDPRCPACAPTNPATAVWQRRRERLHVSLPRQRDLQAAARPAIPLSPSLPTPSRSVAD
jgi:ThiF family protein